MDTLDDTSQARGAAEPEFPIEIVIRGSIPESERQRFRKALLHIADRSPRRPSFIRAGLALESNPAVSTPAEAKVAFEVRGHVLRAHGECATISEAIDLVAERLRQSLHELAERDATRRRRPAQPDGTERAAPAQR